MRSFLTDTCRIAGVRLTSNTRARIFGAALGHLLVVLRVRAVIPARVLEAKQADEEPRRFDVRMDPVRGLAATTRRSPRRTVHCFLLQQIGGGWDDFFAIKPEAARSTQSTSATCSALQPVPSSSIALARSASRFSRFVRRAARNSARAHLWAPSSIAAGGACPLRNQKAS